MKKHTYSATFPDGTTVTRTTARGYTHAWRVLDDAGAVTSSGFAGSLQLAENAASRATYTDRVQIAPVIIERPEDRPRDYKGRLIPAKILAGKL